jgi:asparagine synthase (glutamine-hydrolysing)
MKEALAPLLPGDVLDGRKRGFGAPIGSWLRNELKPLVAHLLSRDAVERRGLFRYEAVRELVRTHDEKRSDGTDRLLALVNLELWARMYLDTRAPADVQAEVQEALA